MTYFAFYLIGILTGLLLYHLASSKKKTRKLSKTEKMVLETVDKLVGTGHLYVDRQQVGGSLGINPYTAFNLMKSLKKQELLDRDGWTFTLSNEGFTYLEGHGPFAQKLEAVWPTK